MPPYTSEPHSAQAVPKAFNLGLEKPVTVPAYGRQVQSIATNAQTFGPNTIANIVIDTSTPGSFLDPTQSLLEFDITFTNTNPYIDFLNFGPAGAASLIQEYRIYCQGTPIVEILDYNLAFETWMKLNNAQVQDFRLYMENSWRAPVLSDESDLNFVKPPMVDLNGIIMWPMTDINKFGDPNTASKKSIGHYLSRANAGTYTPASGDMFPNTAGVNYNNTGNATYYLTSTTAKAPSNGILPPGSANSGVTTNLSAFKTPWNYSHNYNPTDINSTYSNAPGTVNAMTWTNRIDDTYVTWPSTLRPEKKGVNLGTRLQEQAIKNYRLEDYMMYLSNVKNIPVGISPAKSFIKEPAALERPTTTAGNETALANWNLSVTATSETDATTTASLAGTFTHHCAIPLFDGLLGMGAEKQFPTMLIAPGSFYIQIRFAKVEQAVQVTMDPCRRIFGTYRDYVPNVGLPSYYGSEYYGQYLNNNRCDLATANELAGTPSTWMAYTPHAARGTDFAWGGIVALFPPTVAQTKNTAANTAAVQFHPAGNNAYRNNVYWNNYGALDSLDDIAIGDNAAQMSVANAQGFNEGLSTGLPKPQYVPVGTPWIYCGNLFHSKAKGSPPVYVNETAVCYGTYLPCSTPQVRRTNSKAMPGTMSAKNIDKVPTYVINNLRYTGYQTVLSDEITAAIVRSAAKEDVSLQGQTWKTYRTICAASSSQTIILPIKIASANSIHCIFQNQDMYENLNYNSLSGNCPLTSFKWNVDTTRFVGSDTAPTLTGVATTGTPFSIQLRLGNELLPVQPITTVPQLISELERSIHIKGDFGHKIQARATTTGFSSNTYGNLYNNDFMVPYVPIEALDDQTITDNPAFMDYLPQTDYNVFRKSGNYSTGVFVPPESTFCLGWDTDTFPGNNDHARSGRYLGNAPLTLQMTGANGIGTSALSTSSSTDSWSCITIVLCDIRFSIGAGGAIQAYY